MDQGQITGNKSCCPNTVAPSCQSFILPMGKLDFSWAFCLG